MRADVPIQFCKSGLYVPYFCAWGIVEKEDSLFLINFLTILSTLLNFVVWASKPNLSTRKPFVSLWWPEWNPQFSLTPPPTLFLDLALIQWIRVVFFRNKVSSKCSAKTKPSGFFKRVDFWGLVTKGGVRFCWLSETQRSPYRRAHGEIRSAQRLV